MKTRHPLPPVTIPPDYNYVAVFLTLECNLRCSYCINRFGDLAVVRRLLTGEQWQAGLNRFEAASDLPVTLQGGEPTLHPDFFSIVNGIKPDLNIDLLTNLEFSPERFMAEIPPARMQREAPYASIRVSYHPQAMLIEPLAAKAELLLSAGYSIGIWGVLHPEYEKEVRSAQEYCISRGIDFRTKDFLGEHDGKMYGELSYPEACNRNVNRSVRCRTTELIIGPDGAVYRCHGDLYAGREPIGNILDPDLTVTREFRRCDNYGLCNPCDIKLKTNRFQDFGHTSVEIIIGAESSRH
jgi:hypothetical protein